MKNKLKKIEQITREYAFIAQDWDMKAEDDYNDWKKEIAKILKDN